MWHTKGLIFHEQGQLPTLMETDRFFRVYYSMRINLKSYIKFFEIDEQLNVISKSKYAMSPGNRGSFDHSGVMPSCVVGDMMYYTGWHIRSDVPYGHAIGVAKINNDGTLTRIGIALDKNHNDGFMLNSPLVEFNNGRMEMLYCSGTGWIDDYPTYNISKAVNDCNFWRTLGSVEITHNLFDEAISRVSRDKDDGSLYYSWRTKDSSYKLARQHNGVIYDVNVAKSDWDSEMQCYPYICTIDSRKYMFYNGNNYGSTGIGVAEWKMDTF